MADDAVETARAHLVRVVAQTSVGDAAWTIGETAAELIVMRLEALMDAKAPPIRASLSANAIIADRNPGGMAIVDLGQGERLIDKEIGLLPEGFTRVIPVTKRGKLPDGLSHDTHVEVLYRDGKSFKPAGAGSRIMVGEASLFNWKHAGPGLTIVNINGKAEQQQGTIGNPDDDVIGYRMIAPPENKMAMPKAAS